jgi:hypothetical protein
MSVEAENRIVFLENTAKRVLDEAVQVAVEEYQESFNTYNVAVALGGALAIKFLVEALGLEIEDKELMEKHLDQIDGFLFK